MTDANEIIDVAKKYRDVYGLSVIPVSKHKSPFKDFDVVQYRDRYPTDEEIESWWGDKFKSAGIACVCGKLSNRTVIDLDTYKNKNTEDFINSLVPDSFLAPICSTPRGGQHWHFQYTPSLGNIQIDNDDCSIDVKTEGGLVVLPPTHGPNGNAYKWITSPKSNPIGAIPPMLLNYMYIYNKSVPDNGNKRSQTVTNGNIVFNEGSRDNTIFHVANCLVKGGMPEEEIEQLLMLMGEKLCDPPFTRGDILVKIKSAYKRENIKEKSVAEGVREFLEVTTGNFTVTDCHKFLDLVTKGNKSIIMALSRLVKEGKIERIGNHAGTYRKVESGFEIKDWKNASDKLFDFDMPLGIHKYSFIAPGDIILISGVTDAGKSTFAMEFIRLNMQRHKIFYFSSEINAGGLKRRITKSETDIDKWNFVFSDIWDNAVDIIQPNDINILDYIEPPGGDYRLIPNIITDIHNKLKKGKGIAICLLQKKKSTKYEEYEYGAGGQMTLNKASLAINLDPDYPGGKCTLKKVKNRRVDFNPVGHFIKYKIVKGINLLPFGVWETEIEK